MQDTDTVDTAPAEDTPVSFRYPPERKRMLLAIARERGFADLSSFMRDVADQTIAEALRPRDSAA